ncbi:MAG: tetratricopeptide repeat protein [Pseudomonadota bacterium]
MRPARRRSLALLAACLVAPAAAVENDPLPVPGSGPRERATRFYNDGVVHLLARRHAQAQALFEQALALEERFAEAHNNLAYVLRMQGAQHFAASLAHYDRAIALQPTLAQAYAYRGMLFVQQGDLVRARADLQRLLQLDARLAPGLQKAIDAGMAGEDRGGVVGQYE